jgi:drug/metabolite transporter (DMT)-like permease
MYDGHFDNRRAGLEMFFGACGFTVMGGLAHWLSESLSWTFVTFVRMFVTLLFATAVTLYRRAPIIIFGPRILWIRTFFGCCAMCCTFYALTHMPIAHATTILAMNPIWVSLILFLVFKHRTSPTVWGCALLALIGVYIMHRPTFDSASFTILVALAASLFIACAKVTLSRCGAIPTPAVVFHFTAAASLIMLVVTFFTPGTILLSGHTFSPILWPALLVLGIAGTIGQVLLTIALRRGHPTIVSLVGLTQIPLTILIDWYFWERSLDMYHFAGMTLIATAIVLTITTARAPKPASSTA